MVLGSIQLFTEMSTKNLLGVRNEYQEYSWGKARPACKADNLTAICEPIV
jgi:hypothetical protein